MEAPKDFDALLQNVSGVTSFKWFGFGQRSNLPRIRIHTKQGQIDLSIELFRSHLSQEMATQIIASNSASDLPRLILAPAIGAGLSEQFIEAGLCYLDAQGNCHFDLGLFFVHVEGRTTSHPATGSATTGIRRAGYQVLFAYLVDPKLLNTPLREVAAVAGVSRQPVSTLRRRLVDDGYVIGTKSKMQWNPSRFSDAINLWLQGYTATVRPAILKGRFRTRERNPDVIEKQIADGFGAGLSDGSGCGASTGFGAGLSDGSGCGAGTGFGAGLSDGSGCGAGTGFGAGLSDGSGSGSGLRWGGATAAYRMSPHYRGERTVLLGCDNAKHLLDIIEAVPDKKGNLVLLDSFGGLMGPSPDLVPPLLAYSELLQEGSERAREAAQILYDEFIALDARR